MPTSNRWRTNTNAMDVVRGNHARIANIFLSNSEKYSSPIFPQVFRILHCARISSLLLQMGYTYVRLKAVSRMYTFKEESCKCEKVPGVE